MIAPRLAFGISGVTPPPVLKMDFKSPPSQGELSHLRKNGFVFETPWGRDQTTYQGRPPASFLSKNNVVDGQGVVKCFPVIASVGFNTTA